MSEETIVFTITEEDLQEHKRLDSFLAKRFPDLSRSLIKKLFQDDHIQADVKLELKKMPPALTEIRFKMPVANPVDIQPQDIPLEVLFEDEHLIIINKAAGMVVHPAAGNLDGTLVNAILHHCPDLKGIGNEKRPGIVHRLDKGTSGVMVIAKTQKCHEGLVELFSTHDIDRLYEAIALGARIAPSKTLESQIGRSPHNRLKMSTKVKQGKRALTHMKVLSFFDHFSHVELRLETGRTHQIRVHLSELMNSPILNDPLYGRKNDEKKFFNSTMKSLLKDYEHPFLHAKFLGFIHPITKERLEFETKPPEIFQQILESLNDDHR
ncbi:MAG: RNA pseudouridine synthase [Halobacteriovoraceae bacterium]|nr:RNA pseudouridine synthase [Halobacteriovoraceae bacterium]|tara:strand:- start:16089 stop:17057 length:969 start_codon:yes stop_codon:yes gene_type:complete